jgi:XTP/dITP diphosphohydrolase
VSPGRVLVATANPGKLREFRAALEAARLEVVGLEALEDRAEVEETGATFEDNARLKAETYSRRTSLLVLAEDSGLEVDALGGEPGVRSARYGGPGLDDRARVALVLDRLRGVPDARRTARFRCVLALGRGGRVLATFEGAVEGRITHEPRGHGGFGYDPVFFHPAIGRTFAEIRREEKQRLSHRGRALARFLEAVRDGRVVVGPDPPG